MAPDGSLAFFVQGLRLGPSTFYFPKRRGETIKEEREAWEMDILVYIVGIILISCIFGAITKAISSGRGMKGGFGWGF